MLLFKLAEAPVAGVKVPGAREGEPSISMVCECAGRRQVRPTT